MIVAGFGFRAGAPLSSLRDALALAQAGQPPATALATADDKAAALVPLGLPVIAVAARDLASARTITQSTVSLAARQTGSVAEAAALAGAGPGARLLGPRHVSADRMATCALAMGIAE